MALQLVSKKVPAKARRALGKIVQTSSAQSAEEILHAVRAKCVSAAFSLAPGFSQVSGARRIKKPFQRFLCVRSKPLKRFTCRIAFNTRLKPGANEIAGSGIHVASYVTKLIPKKRLEQKFREAVRMARARLVKEVAQ